MYALLVVIEHRETMAVTFNTNPHYYGEMHETDMR
jgi:hypothetical protein